MQDTTIPHRSLQPSLWTSPDRIPLPAGVAGVARRGQAVPAGGVAAAAASAAAVGGSPAIADGGSSLTLSHNCAKVSFSLGGTRVRVKIPGRWPASRGIRGKVQRFSAASRRRLLDMLHQIHRDKMPAMLTLTFPADFPSTTQAKRFLRTFFREMDRTSCGRWAAVWKMEPQERGAPHFHLLVWGVRNCVWFARWAAMVWYRIVGSGNPDHLEHGAHVRPVRSWQGVISYAAKYMGKSVEAAQWDEPGRFWGVYNRIGIPWAELVVVDASIRFGHRLKRFLRRLTGYTYIGHGSQTFYFGNPDGFFLRLDELLALSP